MEVQDRIISGNSLFFLLPDKLSRIIFISFSNYPEQRSTTQTDGTTMGVAGSLTLLQNIGLSSQPASSFDWSRDKMGLACTSAFDQTVRVLITTKLNNL